MATEQIALRRCSVHIILYAFSRENPLKDKPADANEFQKPFYFAGIRFRSIEIAISSPFSICSASLVSARMEWMIETVASSHRRAAEMSLK